jgi:hypothetical protein
LATFRRVPDEEGLPRFIVHLTLDKEMNQRLPLSAFSAFDCKKTGYRGRSKLGKACRGSRISVHSEY